MSNPKLLDMPLAQNADKNDIPVTDSGSTGLFSQQYGWQLINAIPPQNGGKAVKREDFNGVFNLIGDLLYHIQKGYTFEYDSRQSYWKGCKVRDPATGLTYQALNDIPANSTNSPHEDTSNWVICPAEQGYIIPSTAYALGDTANHYALPPSYYLECTTPGTTGATAPVISSPTVGETVTDGTVVWTIRKTASTQDLANYLLLSGGTLTGTVIAKNIAISDGSYISSVVDDKRLEMWGGAGRSGANLTLFGDNFAEDNFKGVAEIRVFKGGQNTNLLCYPDGRMIWRNNDLGGSAIVAKSLGANGYIKYASGLIIQIGRKRVNLNSGSAVQGTLDLPISFTTTNYAFASTACPNDTSNPFAYSITAKQTNLIGIIFPSGITSTRMVLDYVAIGY